jgi:hypothetical protein
LIPKNNPTLYEDNAIANGIQLEHSKTGRVSQPILPMPRHALLYYAEKRE